MPHSAHELGAFSVQIGRAHAAAVTELARRPRPARRRRWARLFRRLAVVATQQTRA